MNLSDFRGVVSNLAVITTIVLFMSGSLVCKQYVVNKTTAESTPLPFICGLVSSSVWFLYGLCKHDSKIILVNCVGVILYICYIIVFYIFTFKKSTVLKLMFVTFLLLILMLGYVSTEEDQRVLLDRLGIIASALTLVTIAAPMSKLFHVLRVKTTECLPFPMIVMSFVVSMLWFLYGVIEQDPYLLLPNFIGASLAISQLSLFVIYPNKPRSPVAARSMIA